jgi:hypothetical protein
MPHILQIYGRWYLILREEDKLNVFQEKLPRRIFGPRTEDVNRAIRKTA